MAQPIQPTRPAGLSRWGMVAMSLAAFALGGCSLSLTPEPPERLLTLESTASAPVGSSAQTGGDGGAPTVAIYTPTTPAKLDVLRVPVAVSETEIAYLQEAFWVEKPSRLFRRLLGETLRAQGTVLVLDGDENPVIASQRLRGTLLDMGYDAQTSSVVVRFDAVRSSASGKVLETRRFEARESAILPEVAAIAPALNRAANVVAGDVAEWMSRAPIEPSAPPIMDEPAQ